MFRSVELAEVPGEHQDGDREWDEKLNIDWKNFGVVERSSSKL
jgi:hypothetical protein